MRADTPFWLADEDEDAAAAEALAVEEAVLLGDMVPLPPDGGDPIPPPALLALATPPLSVQVAAAEVV